MADYEDLMTYLQQQQAQKKATGQPTWSIPELQEVGRGVTRGKEEAMLGREQLLERKREADIMSQQFEEQRRTQMISGVAKMATEAPLTYAASKNYLAQANLANAKAGVATGQVVAPGTETALAAGTPGTTTVTEAGFSSTAPTVSTATGTIPMEGMPIASGGAVAGEQGFFSGTSGVMGPAALGGGLASATTGKKTGELTKTGPIGGGAISGAGGGALATGAMMGAGLTAWSGPGMIVGTVVGAAVGALGAYLSSRKGGKGSKPSVICTELLRQGRVSKELYELEHKYEWPWATYWGYRIWADKVVEGMQKSRALSLVVAILGRAFLTEVAHRVDSARRGSLLGKLIFLVGVPICNRLFWMKVRLYRKAMMWQQDCFKKAVI